MRYGAVSGQSVQLMVETDADKWLIKEMAMGLRVLSRKLKELAHADKGPNVEQIFHDSPL